ncbi:diguanylate cyclase [Aliivibrio wodanis]|uniref:diguanylate cyclase n=1 Tax=Aliivibrio wodanis TaxID=80852 RepID=UPI00406C48FD
MKRHYLLILTLCVSFFGGLSSQAKAISSSPVITVALVHNDFVTRILFDAIEEKLDLNVKYVDYPTTDLAIKGVLNHSVDFVTNVTYTESRSSVLAFSEPTNVENIYLYSKNNTTLERVIRVALPKDSPFISVIESYSSYISIWEYDSLTQGFAWLESGVVDGVIDAMNALELASKKHLNTYLLNTDLPFTPVSIATAIDNEHSNLLKDISQVVLSDMIQRELRLSVEAYQYHLREKSLRKQIAALPINLSDGLSIYLENVFPHAIYRNKDISGISADMVFTACNILAIKCYAKSHSTDSWDDLWQSFKEGNADLIAPLTYVEDRKSSVSYTAPYYIARSILVKRKGYKRRVYTDISQMVSERIGVVKGDYFSVLFQKILPYKTLYEYQNQAEEINALIDEEIDYIALDQATYYQILRDRSDLEIEEELGVGTFHEAEISVGFSKTEKGQLLAPIFSEALLLANTHKIEQKYVLKPDWRNILEERLFFNSFMKYVIMTILAVALLVIWYLNKLASTDQLTGLKNRRAIYQKYRSGVPKLTTILYLDVNKFKQINDTYGHLIGDFVLKEIAKTIKNHWSGDSYRIGGDEFVLMGFVSQDQIDDFIHSACSIIVISGDVSLNVSLAVGVSDFRDGKLSLDHCLKVVDSKMYSSKLKG